MSLTPKRFAEYFSALHGYDPFPWQQRLLDVIVTGRWPSTLALPTASGKTACIDIALFSLACGISNAPRRIFFVVDRRVIVDEAYSRAWGIARALSTAKGGVLREVADALRSDVDDDPLAVFQLRGGTYRDDAWARIPTQPTVICSTVDQIGSRLLFRSYGASPYTWPLHAGLAANDSLILLDEAHCAIPFRQTLDAISRYRTWAERPVDVPFAHVILSATPGTLDKEPFSLQHDDRIHPVLSPRLAARKPARLIECKNERTATEAFAKKLANEANQLAAQGARRIGIIVNRVATARHLFDLLNVPVNRKALFIGRMRPLDRDALMRQWQPVFAAGSKLALEEPCFAVATQCLEVGANLDFDGLVTESASLDALRQRFGRLFRLGEPPHLNLEVQPRSVAVVVMPAPEAKKHKEGDPIYGEALSATWAWLQENAREGAFDFGINAVEGCLPQGMAERSALMEHGQLLPPAPNAPVMLPAHVDCWAQTSPAPLPEPRPELFLHGPRNTRPDVQVCWRIDLDGTIDPSDWAEIVAVVPPSSAECMSVPLHIVRQWLQGSAGPYATIGDVDAADDDSEADISDSIVQLRGLIWRGEEQSVLSSAESDDSVLRPGDTLILPVSAGGWNVFGAMRENDESQPAQPDCGDEANLRARARAAIRFHPALVAHLPECDARSAVQVLLDSENIRENCRTPEFREEIKPLLASLATSLANLPNEDDRQQWSWLRVAAEHLATKTFEIEAHPALGFVLTGRGKLSANERLRLRQFGSVDEADFSTEDDSASFTTQIRLPIHLQGVASFARRFADGCGLTTELARDVELAASLHDLGKADARFQAWLRGGLPFPVAHRFADMLAKSGGASNASARRRARERAAYPEGGRHELLSVRLVESDPAVLSAAHDPELVLHLVASHHGRCRPFAPVVEDSTPVEVSVVLNGQTLQHSSDTRLERLDSGVAERFWNLVRRYGWWGLAYLEAIHVLADHRCSEGEQTTASRDK